MKKVMFALCFMFGGVVTLMAQEEQDTTSNQYRTETQSQYPQDAQDGTQQNPLDAQAQYQQQDRERIQSTELPDEVKRTLEGAEYRGWLISGAFKAKGSDEQSSMQSEGNVDVTTPDNTNANDQGTVNATDTEQEEIYIVELKNGAETKTLRFDKDGQKLEDMAGQDQNNQNQNTQSPNNQYNQNEQGVQMEETEETDPNEEAGQTDPGTTSDQAEQSTDFNQSTETRTDESMESSDEAIESTESVDDIDAADEDAHESTETETQSSQSTETDQSKANEPQ